MAEREETLKSLLMNVEEETEKAGLKLGIQNAKIMVSDPIISWQMDGGTLETVIDSTFLGSRLSVDYDYSHEIKRHLLLGRKAMTNLDNVLKRKDITLLRKVPLVKAMAFPVVMYGCESWTIKKAERKRIDAFELWCWRRLLRVPWTARRSNQSILKEISPGCSLERLMLKLQYFGHLVWRADSLEKTDARKDWKRRKKQAAEMRWFNSITTSVDMGLSKLWDMVRDREAWRAAVLEFAKSQTWLSPWTAACVPRWVRVLQRNRADRTPVCAVCALCAQLSVRLPAAPPTAARQAPLSVGFSSKNPGVGCHAPLQGIFPTQRLNPEFPASLALQADSLPWIHQGSLMCTYICHVEGERERGPGFIKRNWLMTASWKGPGSAASKFETSLKNQQAREGPVSQ